METLKKLKLEIVSFEKKINELKSENRRLRNNIDILEEVYDGPCCIDDLYFTCPECNWYYEKEGYDRECDAEGCSNALCYNCIKRCGYCGDVAYCEEHKNLFGEEEKGYWCKKCEKEN